MSTIHTIIAVGMLCVLAGIVGVQAGRGLGSSKEPAVITIQRDSAAACQPNEAFWFRTDDVTERTCIDVDVITQDVVRTRCQEDEVFAWVANDVRGCVNYEEIEAATTP